MLLRDIRGMAYQEIAERLDLPEGTVKSRINRGRLELVRQIQRLQESVPGGRRTLAVPVIRPTPGAQE